MPESSNNERCDRARRVVEGRVGVAGMPVERYLSVSLGMMTGDEAIYPEERGIVI